jgi:hypothetical protein
MENKRSEFKKLLEETVIPEVMSYEVTKHCASLIRGRVGYISTATEGVDKSPLAQNINPQTLAIRGILFDHGRGMTALMYQCIVVFLLFSCSVAKIEIPLYVDNIKKGINK